jgi:transcriptional regulator with XRE-family HTH domain
LSDVERRAGGDISDSYVAGITNGNVRNLTLDKLKALARGLGISEYKLIAVASGFGHQDPAFQESDFANLFSKYRYLSDDDKREVQVLLNVLDHELERRQRGSEISLGATISLATA